MNEQDSTSKNLPNFIFSILIGSCILAIFMLPAVANLGELRDKLLLFSCVSMAMITMYSKFPSRLLRSRFRKLVYTLGASNLILLGLVPLERHTKYFPDIDITRILWCGFGLSVTLSFLLISMPISAKFIYSNEKYSRIRNYAFSFLLLLATISFYQDARNVIDSSHSEYVINEILSFSAGHTPYFDFVPQYQTLYGLALIPFRGILSGYELLQLTFGLLYFLSLTTIYLLVRLARKCLRDQSCIR